MSHDTLGIYLSIPFCKAKCSFCNFASGVFAAEKIDPYVDRLCAELREAKNLATSLGATLPKRVDTIYFGGGTPSLLEPRHLHQIFATLHGHFALDPDAEITLEAAPGQIANATLGAAIQLGVNRISFGVQSFIDAESAAVGRTHTAAQCHAEIARMKSAGIPRLSLDLIAGLPYQTEQTWADSLQQAIDSGVDHTSVYVLEVDGDSRLGREALAAGSRYHADALPAEDATADWYQAACDHLATAGLAQYEISNFARSGFASRHNNKYWQRLPYFGVGLDAHSMLLCGGGLSHRAVRFANGHSMDEYLRDRASIPLANNNAFPLLNQARTVDRINASAAFEESLFLGLRLNDGVDFKQLAADFGSPRLDAAFAALEEVEQAGLVRRTASRIFLTPAGRLASNEVFSRLLAA